MQIDAIYYTNIYINTWTFFSERKLQKAKIPPAGRLLVVQLNLTR